MQQKLVVDQQVDILNLITIYQELGEATRSAHNGNENAFLYLICSVGR
jgi:hypothetical protein